MVKLSKKLNKRQNPKLPKWDLGPMPSPDDPEAFQEWGSEAAKRYAKRDRIDAAHQEELLKRLAEEFGGALPADRTLILKLAEQYVPAFMAAGKRGREPETMARHRLVWNVDRIVNAQTKEEAAVIIRRHASEKKRGLCPGPLVCDESEIIAAKTFKAALRILYHEETKDADELSRLQNRLSEARAEIEDSREQTRSFFQKYFTDK